MSRRYIALVSGLTDAEEKEFIAYLRGLGINWWHRIPNCWFMVDEADQDRSPEIRTRLMDATGSKRGIVLDVSDVTQWSGFALKDEADEVFKWIHRNWPPGGS